MSDRQLWTDIQRLYTQYNRAVDAHDIDAWVDTYSPEAVFRGRVTLNGHEEIRSFAQGERRRLQRRGYERTQHRIANLLIEPISDSEVQGSCDLLIVLQPINPSRPYAFLVASYRDAYVNQSGRWRFSERQVDWWPPRPPSPPTHDLLGRISRRVRRTVRRPR